MSAPPAARQRHAATQAVAGTRDRRRRGDNNLRRGRIAEDVARNLAANSLANAGRGKTSTGSAVSVAQETVVPFAAFSHFAHQHHAGQRQSHRHLGLDLHLLQSAEGESLGTATDAIGTR